MVTMIERRTRYVTVNVDPRHMAGNGRADATQGIRAELAKHLARDIGVEELPTHAVYFPEPTTTKATFGWFEVHSAVYSPDPGFGCDFIGGPRGGLRERIPREDPAYGRPPELVELPALSTSVLDFTRPIGGIVTPLRHVTYERAGIDIATHRWQYTYREDHRGTHQI